MKSILLASALFSVATLASAQRVEAGQGQPMSGADTLITLTEGELAEAVQRVAAARLAAERSAVTLQSQQQTTHLNSGISVLPLVRRPKSERRLASSTATSPIPFLSRLRLLCVTHV